MSSGLDADLDAMDRAALLSAAQDMRRAIRTHRDTSMHELCWHHPDMWALLPEPPTGKQILPDWPQFMRGCTRYRQSLDTQLADGPRSDKEFGQ